MGRQIIDLTYNKNKVLLLTYIFRCLPTLYLTTIGKTNLEKQEMRNIIVLLQRDKFVTVREALHEVKFLTLTKGGYDYINGLLLVGDGQALYQHKASRVMRKNVS